MPITASAPFERVHMEPGVYDATIVGWREKKEDGTPFEAVLDGRKSTFGVLDFDVNGSKIGRQCSLKLNVKSVLGKVYLAVGVKFQPGETHDPGVDLTGKKCLVNVVDNTIIDRLSSKPVTVSKIETIMPPKKGGRA